jgi:hypothetical protein
MKDLLDEVTTEMLTKIIFCLLVALCIICYVFETAVPLVILVGGFLMFCFASALANLIKLFTDNGDD